MHPKHGLVDGSKLLLRHATATGALGHAANVAFSLVRGRLLPWK